MKKPKRQTHEKSVQKVGNHARQKSRVADPPSRPNVPNHEGIVSVFENAMVLISRIQNLFFNHQKWHKPNKHQRRHW